MRFFLLAALALAGCDARQAGADGYRFEQREWTLSPLTVRVVEHRSQAALLAEARRSGAEFGHGRHGEAFAVVRPGDGTCDVHVLAPEAGWRPEWIGHEAAHCFWGRWHGAGS